MTTETDAAQLPGDLDTALDQIRDHSVPLASALEYVSRRAEDDGVPQSELDGWRTTRDLLAAARERYEGVSAVLRGEEPRPVRHDENVDADALSSNLRGLEQIVAGWRMLVTGKTDATDELAAIWAEVLARGEVVDPKHRELLAQFQAERRDLHETGNRLQLALEYLWCCGRPRPSTAYPD